MADTLVFLELAHRTIDKLLALVELQCSDIDAGNAPNYPLLQRVFDFLRDYPRHCQYPKSALAFRRLQAKDAEAAAQVGKFLGDQAPLTELTVRVGTLVKQAETEGRAKVLEMRHALRSFVREYRSHLDAESERFFPTLKSVLTRADWDLIDFQMFDQEQPIYDREVEERFLRLKQQILDVDQPSEDPRESA